MSFSMCVKTVEYFHFLFWFLWVNKKQTYFAFFFLKERQEVEFWVSCSQLYSWHLCKYMHIRNSVNTYRRKWMNQSGRQLVYKLICEILGDSFCLFVFIVIACICDLLCVCVHVCMCDLVKRLRAVKNQSIILWIWEMTIKNNVSIRRENKMTLDISTWNITLPVHQICWQTSLNFFFHFKQIKFFPWYLIPSSHSTNFLAFVFASFNNQDFWKKILQWFPIPSVISF